MARREARELAFRTLFQAERSSEPLMAIWQSVRIDSAQLVENEEYYEFPLDTETLDFAETLISAYDQHEEAIDTELEAIITGWSFTQMAQTDLNILRLAVAEYRHHDTPLQVVIEVAIRLAKKFGGEDSGRFVNGVLAKLVEKEAHT